MAELPELSPLSDSAPLRITPTDVSQFVRLDQCQRFLRLKLTENNRGSDFMRANRTAPQDPPPLMMHGGTDFEAEIYAQIRRSRPVRDLREQSPRPKDDGGTLKSVIGALMPGNEIVLLQPRLQAQVGLWALRGDVDVLRLRRDEDGRLSALIVDVKSSAVSKVEHRLQIAFYTRMLAETIETNILSPDAIGIGVLYRGDDTVSDETDRQRLRAVAMNELGAEAGYLELVEDPAPYLAAVDDLVTGTGSASERIAAAPFDEIPFHLTYRCDWCRFNPFCMRWAAEHDDLSLVPYLTENDKLAIQRAGVKTAKELSLVKIDRPGKTLVPNPENPTLAVRLATTWPVGERLDELVLRARRYRGWKGDQVKEGNRIVHRGYGSLPYCDAEQNPNLVRIAIDAQHDAQTGHIYLIGAAVAAAENGVFQPERRAAIVRMSEGPPETLDDERALLLDWIDATLRAAVSLATPDGEGKPKAPIHLVFFNRFDQELFLDALARHAATILGATPLYDFVTQLAAFDSPVATFLVDEIRELRNYPMLSQSLQSVTTFLGFDWNQPLPFRRIFRERMFDYVGKFDGGDPTAPEGTPWYSSRSRFDSTIPIEYAYAAWDRLPPPTPGGKDEFAPYRQATREAMLALQTRRLEAIERIVAEFEGNKYTTKSAFDLPDLAQFEERGTTLAQALAEFITIERHVTLNGWKSARLLAPERRVLAGQSLVTVFDETDNLPGVAALMRESLARYELQERLRAEYKAANPDAKRVSLPKEQKEASQWSNDGAEVRLRLVTDGIDCSLGEALDLTTLREGDTVVITQRWMVDERLPIEQQAPFQPTPKRILYGMRGVLQRFETERDESGQVLNAAAVVKFRQGGSGTQKGGFVFGAMDRPLITGERYVLDSDPNDWNGHHTKLVVDGLVAGKPNALYDRLVAPRIDPVAWPDVAASAQQRFLDGLTALAEQGQFLTFEPSKREFIAEHGATPTLLVQGPPGTGKSFTTAYALFARMQGAMAADIDFRVIASCHTHAAVDVVLRNLGEARETLARIQHRFPELFAAVFDARLLDVPIFRFPNRDSLPHGAVGIREKGDSTSPIAFDRLSAARWCVLGATPGGVRKLLNEKAKEWFGHELVDCLVLDEASQLSLPTAIMAALPLKENGRLIVVGDHRQMPPIVKHDWSSERKRTFQEFRAFDSLFQTLLGQTPRPPLIQFAESFRLHADIAEFLRREIYRHDGIAFRSRRDWRLAPLEHADPLVAAVLSPAHPLVVVLHDERQSQLSNVFERDLILDLANALYDERVYDAGERESDGFGIVVPHRAQRAALMGALLAYPDRVGGKPVIADTVERFQGDERDVIVFSATESDPAYLLTASGFLLDPRRLNVALSRAKRKLILVASRSVFEFFSPDEETFANAQLWRDLLARTCTVPLWSGDRYGRRVDVWGNERKQH